MTTRRSFLAAAGVVAVAGCLGSDTGTEGPKAPDRIKANWPLPAHDAGRSNYTPDSSGPTAAVGELWSMSADAQLSSPVVADGTVYVASAAGGVRAIDARTGEETWHISVGSPATTPSVFSNGLSVPTTDSVVALDSAGEERWRIETPNRKGFLAAPHGVYTVSNAGELTAVDAAGEERWTRHLEGPWTPHLFAAEGRLFVSTGTANPVPWVFDIESGDFAGAERPSESGNHFSGERFAVGDRLYASDPFYGTLWAYDIADGKYDRLWSDRVGDPGGDRVAADETNVYAYDRSGPSFGAFDTTDGSENWSHDGVGELTSRPLVTATSVLVATEDAVRCLDSADGTERWSRDISGGDWAVVDDVLYVTDGEQLRAFRAP